MSGTIYASVDVETVGGFGGKLIFDATIVLHDYKGNTIDAVSILIVDTLPFVGADGFWSSRKNDLLIRDLGKRRLLNAVEAFELMQSMFDRADIWVAYNSAYEKAAFTQSTLLLHLDELVFPEGEIDLALFAMEALPMRAYVLHALEHKFLTEKGNISSKCEHLLDWLGLDMVKHTHLSRDDTLTQVELWKRCVAVAEPKLGRRLVHPSHPVWRELFWRTRKPQAC